MIQLQHVSKTYQTASGSLQALKDINLSVDNGEIFGIIGKSGAGKSTLIRCVNLLERPTSGQVFVAGHELTLLTEDQLRKTRRKIGMIFQHFNLLSARTVYQNVAFPLELIHTDKNKIKEMVMPLLELTGLTEKAHDYPAQLSGGQKQRVAIARALACQPDVLLCDEATSSLDPHTTIKILQLLKEINQKLKLTILLITHEMEVIKLITDRVALLENGEIIEQGSTVDFFIDPKTPSAKQIVASNLKHELPDVLLNKIDPSFAENKNPVIRILFHGKAAAEPVIAYLMQQLNMKINILQANIEFLKATTLGVMVVEIISPGAQLNTAIQYLENNHITVEIIGYVEPDAFRAA
jgi:D-methionine transport system ATP-binding protein